MPTVFDSEMIGALAHNPSYMQRLGIVVPTEFSRIQSAIRNKSAHFAGTMDADITQPVTNISNFGTPVQFLQEFLQGVVHILTTSREADELAKLAPAGKWSDEEVVQRVHEHLGTPVLYRDAGDTPAANFSQVFDRRTIVRFELGLENFILEEERMASTGANSATEKRAAVAYALEILRNQLFFFGFNNGDNRTYGFLNDPNLTAYTTVATGGGGGTDWSSKTPAEIAADLNTAGAALRSQSGNNVKLERQRIIIAVAASSYEYLNKSDSSNGAPFTAMKWLKDSYPSATVLAVPELDAADGGENAFYMYAESLAGSGTDDGSTIIQLVPEKFRALNVVPTNKGSKEAYTNACAGALIKRPYAVVRFSGI